MDERFNIRDADWTPFIAPDESYFIFCSFRKGGFGSGDLYISFKRPDGTWGDPINMGDRVTGAGDVYWIDAKVIEELRSRAPK